MNELRSNKTDRMCPVCEKPYVYFKSSGYPGNTTTRRLYYHTGKFHPEPKACIEIVKRQKELLNES